MTPEETAALVRSYAALPDVTARLAPLRSQLSLAVIAVLKQQVDDEKLRNSRNALQIADVALAAAMLVDTPEALGLACWARGNALFHLSRYDQAIESYQQATPIYAAMGRQLDVARLQINQVAALRGTGDHSAALALAEQARAACAMIGASAQRFLALLDMNIGAVYRQMGDLAAALAAYARGRESFVALGDAVETTRIDINRANVLQEMGRFAEAEALLSSARAALAVGGYHQEVARADHNLGMLAYRRGQHQAALRHMEAARNGFAAIPNPGDVAMVDLFRSFVYRDLNLLHETITLAAAAERTLKRDTAGWLCAMAQINQGAGYRRLGLWPRAERLLSRARRILRQQGATSRLLTLDLERAELLIEAGQPARARRLGQRIARQLVADTWPALEAGNHLLLARCALAATPPDQAAARQHSQVALALAERYDLPVRATAEQVLGQVAELAGDMAAAWRWLQAAMHSVEAARARLPVDELQTSFMDAQQGLYAAAVRLSQGVASPAELLVTLNRAANAPLPQLVATPTPPDPALAARRRELREAWHWHQSQLDTADALLTKERSPAELEALRRKVHQIEAELAELTRRHQVQASPQTGTAHPTIDDPLAFSGQLQASLARDALLLHYYQHGDMLAVAIVSPAGIERVPGLTALAPVQRLLRSWQLAVTLASANVRPQLQRLYHALVAPLAPHLANVQRIWLVLPPEWHDLPYAALFDGQAHLVERCEIVRLAAPAALLHASTAPAARGAASALVVGYSDGARLPQTLVEARQVAATLAPHLATSRLLEDETTRQRLVEGIQGYDLLHLATHAVFRPDNPFFSWLRLADARLTVAELYELQLPRRPLVVLSACETGRGQPRGGGLLGMARGFFAAGAAGLIVSLWQVADQPTAELMADLYRCLAGNWPAIAPGTALAMAQRQAIARGAHPLYWAGFSYIV